MLINGIEYNVIDIEVDVPAKAFTRFARTAVEFKHLTDAYYCNGFMVILFEDESESGLYEKSSVLSKDDEMIFEHQGIFHYSVINIAKAYKAFKDVQSGLWVQRVEIKFYVYKKEGVLKDAMPVTGTLPAKPLITTNIGSSISVLEYTLGDKKITLRHDFEAGDVIMIDIDNQVVKLNGVVNMKIVDINSDMETFLLEIGNNNLVSTLPSTFVYRERFI